jgi:hypothetical protein
MLQCSYRSESHAILFDIRQSHDPGHIQWKSPPGEDAQVRQLLFEFCAASKAFAAASKS